MDLGLSERVALVVGADHELRLPVAMALAGEGAKIAICAESSDGLRRTELELMHNFGQASVLAVPFADMTGHRDGYRIAVDVFNRFGQVDILVYLSGEESLREEENLREEAAHLINDVGIDYINIVRLCRAVIPYMREEHWGRIINVESVPVAQLTEGFDPSAHRQLHLVGYFKKLVRDVASYNITVNNVLAGVLKAPGLKEQLELRSREEGASLPELEKRASAGIPMGRLGNPEEVGDMVAFLASERAGYITGASISVDGGQRQGFL